MNVAEPSGAGQWDECSADVEASVGDAMVGCKRCGGEVVQRSLGRLALAGLLMLAAPGLGVLWWPLWLPAIVCALTGVYLLAWASVERGRWCRGCKRFDGV